MGADLTLADPTGADSTVADPTVADPTVADPTVVDPTGANPTGANPTTAGRPANGQGLGLGRCDVPRGKVMLFSSSSDGSIGHGVSFALLFKVDGAAGAAMYLR